MFPIVVKISGICVLLGGIAAASPQAQIQTGVSSPRPPVRRHRPQQVVGDTGANQPVPEQSAPVKPLPGTAMQQTEQPAQGSPVQQQPQTRQMQQPQAQQMQMPQTRQGQIPQAQQMQVPQAQAQPDQQRPGDMPPVSPRISYQNGLLTVQAPNSTLSDILNGIRRQAGIQFEGAQGAYDRVAANFGPAPADEVLTSLLRGSRFDYVIVGSPENPDIVQRVILTPRNGGPTPVAGTAPPGRPGMSPQPGGGDPEDEAEENNNVPSETVQPDQPQQPAQVQPQMQLPADQGENAPKTTEQLLEELKQMQQQQQNQQNPQNQPTSPLKTGVPNQPPPVRRIPQ